MDGLSVMQTRNMVFWIALAVGSSLLTGLAPACMRLGAKKNDPTAASALFALVFVMGSFGVAALKGTLPALWSLDNKQVVRIVLSGVLSMLVWLSIFTALTGGLCSRVMPIVNLSTVAVLVASHYLLGTALGLWRLCCIVLILLGTVLIESRVKGARSKLWMFYAALGALFYAGLQLTGKLFLADVDQTLVDIGRGSVALVLLLIFLFARGKQKTFDRMGVTGWLCIPAAAVCCCGSVALDYLASLRGDMSLLAPVTLVGFGSMLLFARLFLKEQQPGSALFGTLLVLLGMFAILMGW